MPGEPRRHLLKSSNTPANNTGHLMTADAQPSPYKWDSNKKSHPH